MIFLKAFLFSGTICLICEIVLDNTKLTPGHITSGVTVIGAFLSFLGIYDKIVSCFGAGATVLISNFGHMLFSSGMAGYSESGILGIFSKLLCSSGIAIVSVLVISFTFTMIFKAKD